VNALKAREPDRFDVLDCLPGETAQVDFGLGALTRLSNGKYRRLYLFVMSLKFSGKSFRKVIWKAYQQSWARLHEEAFRSFGGAPAVEKKRYYPTKKRSEMVPLGVER
jgi:transposase